jgi:ribosomal protein S18 acetylase RimI-like enzyme
VLGYTCFGPIPGTEGRYDLYWLAVKPDQQRSGLGRELMARTEERVRKLGGDMLFANTSGLDAYRPARRFYRRCGYRQVAELPVSGVNYLGRSATIILAG